MAHRFLFALLFSWVAGAAHAQAGSIAVTVSTPAGEPVADAVVVVVPSDAAGMPAARPRAEEVDQIDKDFVPKVKVVYVGSTVAFPNRDTVRHHVYSFSPAKRFELPLYAGVPSQPVLFDKPGVVVLGCNIHDWMVGYIYVSESPYFARTGADGKALIADLPPRRYTLRVWHAQQEGTEDDTRQAVDVPGAARVERAIRLALKPEVRVRRAPTGSRMGHY